MAKAALTLPEAKPPISYRLGDCLYLNLTNRCTARCRFCPRLGDWRIHGLDLRLPREPMIEEVLAAVPQPGAWREIVFCGLGEPTMRVGVLTSVAAALRRAGAKRLRLNTNGHGNLINRRDIVPELAGAVDVVSVSLNAAEAETYARIMGLGRRGRRLFDEMLGFVRSASRLIREVRVSVVMTDGVDIEAARRLGEELGASLRCRPLFGPGGGPEPAAAPGLAPRAGP